MKYEQLVELYEGKLDTIINLIDLDNPYEGYRNIGNSWNTQLPQKEYAKHKIAKILKNTGTQNPDGSWDIDGNVYLDDLNLKEMPVKFRKVTGNFDISSNKLTSLKNSPEEIGGYFDARDNPLTNIEFAPAKVKGKFLTDYKLFTVFNYDDLIQLSNYKRIAKLVEDTTTDAMKTKSTIRFNVNKAKGWAIFSTGYIRRISMKRNWAGVQVSEYSVAKKLKPFSTLEEYNIGLGILAEYVEKDMKTFNTHPLFKVATNKEMDAREKIAATLPDRRN